LNINTNSKISELKDSLSQQFKLKADVQTEVDKLESRILQLLDQLKTQELTSTQFQSKYKLESETTSKLKQEI